MTEHSSRHSLRGVGQFVINKTESFSQLSGGSSFERTIKFNKKLINGITTSDLTHTGLTGDLFEMVVPKEDSRLEKQLAVIKFINSDSNYFRLHGEDNLKQVRPGEINELLKNPDFIYFDNKPMLPKYEGLNNQEKLFASLAWEHNLHQMLFSPFVKPAIFLAFNSANEIAHKTDNFSKGIVEKYKQGEPIFTMIQDFEKIKPINFESMEKEVKEQLRALKGLVEQAYYDEGFYPDTNIVVPNSGNLVVNEKKELILIDTNYINRRRDSDKKYFHRMMDALDYYCR